MKTIFELQNGRILNIDFASIKQLKKISKSDWQEIDIILKDWTNIVKSKFSEKEYNDLMINGYQKSNFKDILKYNY